MTFEFSFIYTSFVFSYFSLDLKLMPELDPSLEEESSELLVSSEEDSS